MNKISLVTRRKDKSYDTPTAALERAEFRSYGCVSDISVKDGDPTLAIPVDKNDSAPVEDYLKNIFGSVSPSTIPAEITRDIKGEIQNLVVRFVSERGKEKLLTARQLAEMVSMHKSTIYRFAREHRINGFKIGRVWRFDWDTIAKAAGFDSTKRGG